LEVGLRNPVQHYASVPLAVDGVVGAADTEGISRLEGHNAGNCPTAEDLVEERSLIQELLAPPERHIVGSVHMDHMVSIGARRPVAGTDVANRDLSVRTRPI